MVVVDDPKCWRVVASMNVCQMLMVDRFGRFDLVASWGMVLVIVVEQDVVF